MKKLLLLLLIALPFIFFAQTTFDCKGVDFCDWDGEEWVNCSGDDKNLSVFVMNSSETSFTWRNDGELYKYNVTEKESGEDGVFTYFATERATGDDYYFIFDMKNDMVKAVYTDSYDTEDWFLAIFYVTNIY